MPETIESVKSLTSRLHEITAEITEYKKKLVKLTFEYAMTKKKAKTLGASGFPDIPPIPDIPGLPGGVPGGDGCDMGATCDSDHCKFGEFDKTLQVGQDFVCIQDDQDKTNFTVVCQSGCVCVVLARATEYTWEEWGKKVLNAGEYWIDSFGQATPGKDQSVMLRMVGIVPGTKVGYTLESWDV